jgi:uncharacterized protein (TIGR04255 family)
MSPNEPKTEQAPPAVVYPGAPLRAVAIEVSFPALLDAFERFGAFQRRHLDEFNLHETPVEDKETDKSLEGGSEFARQGSLVLMSKNRERAVTIARDQLAFITYPYSTGFAGFRSWAMPLLREGLADLTLDSVLGVSFRYENRIKHDTSNLDLASILRIGLPAPAEAESTIRHVHLYWHQAWAGGTVEVDVNGCPQFSAKELHLNITAYLAGGPLAELDGLVQEAHRRARLTFEVLITSRFRDALRSTST